MAYPFDDTQWFGRLAEVRQEFHQLLMHISRSEQVNLICQEPLDEALFPDSVKQYSFELDDIWLRDSGPIFTLEEGTQVVGRNFQFNGWGRKFPFAKDARVGSQILDWHNLKDNTIDWIFEGGSIDVNGFGAALTTRQCLLSKERNPFPSSEICENILRESLNVKELIWLESGLIDDHTDGHIDMIARFCSPGTVLCHYSQCSSHPSFGLLESNYRRLCEFAQSANSAIHNIIRVPMPENVEIFQDRIVPKTYLNFYICNAGVIVPTYDDQFDESALSIIQSAFPDRDVKGSHASHIIYGGGAFNCLTQQVPLGDDQNGSMLTDSESDE